MHHHWFHPRHQDFKGQGTASRDFASCMGGCPEMRIQRQCLFQYPVQKDCGMHSCAVQECLTAIPSGIVFLKQKMMFFNQNKGHHFSFYLRSWKYKTITPWNTWQKQDITQHRKSCKPTSFLQAYFAEVLSDLQSMKVASLAVTLTVPTMAMDQSTMGYIDSAVITGYSGTV